MNKQSRYIVLFLLMALVQLAMPLNMILESRSVLESGNQFRFEMKPIDPTDYFRGKYIVLSFGINEITVSNADEWKTVTKAYAAVSEGPDGFAQINDVSIEPPSHTDDYFEVEVYLTYDSLVHLTLPFERYYMEEGKVRLAEDLYRQASRDSSNSMYAAIRVYKGKSIIEDILFNGTSLNSYLDQAKIPEFEEEDSIEAAIEIMEVAPVEVPDTLNIEAVEAH